MRKLTFKHSEDIVSINGHMIWHLAVSEQTFTVKMDVAEYQGVRIRICTGCTRLK